MAPRPNDPSHCPLVRWASAGGTQHAVPLQALLGAPGIVGARHAVAEVSSPPGTRIPAPRVGRGKRERTYGFNFTQTSVFLLRA